MRISDWSSDVCSSDLPYIRIINIINLRAPPGLNYKRQDNQDSLKGISRRNQVRMFGIEEWTIGPRAHDPDSKSRSEEHTSELQSLMRIPYAVFCLHNKTPLTNRHHVSHHKTQNIHIKTQTRSVNYY